MDEQLRPSDSREEILGIVDDILNDIEVTELNSFQMESNDPGIEVASSFSNNQASVPPLRDGNRSGHVIVREIQEVPFSCDIEKLIPTSLQTDGRDVRETVREIHEEPLDCGIQVTSGCSAQNDSGDVLIRGIVEDSIGFDIEELHQSTVQNGSRNLHVRGISEEPLRCDIQDLQRFSAQNAIVSTNRRCNPKYYAYANVKMLPQAYSSSDSDSSSLTSESDRSESSGLDLSDLPIVGFYDGIMANRTTSDHYWSSESDEEGNTSASPTQKSHRIGNRKVSEPQPSCSFAKRSHSYGEPSNFSRHQRRNYHVTRSRLRKGRTPRDVGRCHQSNTHAAASQVKRKYVKLRQKRPRTVNLLINDISLPSTSKNVAIDGDLDDENDNNNDTHRSQHSTIAAVEVKRKYKKIRQRKLRPVDLVRSNSCTPSTSGNVESIEVSDEEKELSGDEDDTSHAGSYLQTSITASKVIRKNYRVRHKRTPIVTDNRHIPSTSANIQSQKCDGVFQGTKCVAAPAHYSCKRKAESRDDLEDELSDEFALSTSDACENRRVRSVGDLVSSYPCMPSSSCKRKAETHDVFSDEVIDLTDSVDDDIPPPPPPQRFPIFLKRRKRRRIYNDDLFIKRLTPCDELKFLARDVHFRWVSFAQAKERMENIFNRVDRRENFWSPTHHEYSYEALVKTCKEDSALQIIYMLLTDDDVDKGRSEGPDGDNVNSGDSACGTREIQSPEMQDEAVVVDSDC